MKHRYGSLTRAARALFLHRQAERGPQYLVQQMKKVTLQTSLTHIAMVCDDTAIQPLLPQVIVANTNTVLRKALLSSHHWVTAECAAGAQANLLEHRGAARGSHWLVA